MMNAMRPFDVASESWIVSPRPSAGSAPLTVPRRARLRRRHSRRAAAPSASATGGCRSCPPPAARACRRSMSDATLPRAIAKVSGDSVSRPWSSVERQVDVGDRHVARLDVADRPFQVGVEALQRSTGSAASGRMRCGAAPVAAAAAIAPLRRDDIGIVADERPGIDDVEALASSASRIELQPLAVGDRQLAGEVAVAEPRRADAVKR